MSDREDLLDQVVEAVRAAPKYRAVAAGLVRRVAAAELAKGRRRREAIKATKRKLHQVAGAYLGVGVHYDVWLEELGQAACSGDQVALRAACARIMGHHASTRERLPILEAFYAETLAGLPPIHSVLDIGCGLNPLAIPWMPLSEGAAYYAYDIYEDMAAFLDAFMAHLPVQGRAEACDVVTYVPPGGFDLALLLKTIPCLEQVDRAAGRRLLETVPADYLLVSFPVASLGGRRDKGMSVNYEAHLWTLLEGHDWPVERFGFDTETVFRIDKGGKR